MPLFSWPPYCFGHDIPSQPRAASLRMKARLAGVSTVCESCSGLASTTSGVACTSRNASSSAANSSSSAENSNSTSGLPAPVAGRTRYAAGTGYAARRAGGRRRRGHRADPARSQVVCVSRRVCAPISRIAARRESARRISCDAKRLKRPGIIEGPRPSFASASRAT